MINLLPVEEKNSLKMEEKWRLVLLLGILLLSFFLCLILILYSIKLYTTSTTESQNVAIEITKKEFEKTGTKELKDKISAANKNFQKLDIFYQRPLYISSVLEEISNNLPAGMYLRDFSSQRQISEKEETFNIIISGFAPSTDALFNFRKNLETAFSTKVEVGDSWIKPADFRFVFNIKIVK